MNIELISFKICPFAQRTVITMLYKNIPHTITYIDLASPPDGFKQISPFGKVPVLKVDDQQVIFESAIINEFLNEISSAELLPDEPLARAINRSWIDFSTNLMSDFSGLIHSVDANGYNNKLQVVKRELDYLEKKLGNGPYFNAELFSLVDIAYAPLFMRAGILNLCDELYPATHYPKISSWAEKVLSLPEIAKSVVSDFDELFKGHIINKAPYVATHLNL